MQLHQFASGGNISTIQRAVITPDEVRRLERQQQVLLYEGLKPVLANKLAYHTDSEFKNMFDSDPYIVGKGAK